MLAEPPPTNFDLRFQVAGFPVRVVPWFWLTTFLLGFSASQREVAPVFIWVAVVFVSILAHELGHALMFRRFGSGARIVLYQLGGLAIAQEGHSYLPDYNRPANDTRARVLIHLAGPAAGFVVAAILLAILIPSGRIHFVLDIPFWYVDMANRRVATLVHYALWVNVFWGLINLLPVYPLDGGQVARELLTLKNARAGIENSLMLSMVTAVAVGVGGLAYFRDRTGFFIAIMFGVLAFLNYRILQAYRASAFGGYGGESGGYFGGQDDDDWWKK